MAKTEPKAAQPAKKNKYLLQMTRKGVFLGTCLIFFISAWMFVLGVLVGRGTAPVHFDIEVLQKELIALKESIIRQGQERERAETPSIEKSQELDFYEALKDSNKAEKLTFNKGAESATAPEKKSGKTDAAPRKPLVSMKKKTMTEANSNAGTRDLEEGAYSVQVASSREIDAADRLVKMLGDKGYPAYIIKAEVAGKGTWYRVRAGNFNSPAEAEKVKGKIAALGYKGMVVKN